jgi:hypothetical protein
MTPEDADKRLRQLIAKAFVPSKLCASDREDIEIMLDAAGGEPLSKGRIERILEKAKGGAPVGVRAEKEPVWSEDRMTEVEEALVALHRNEGGEMLPEIQEKLRRLREKARSEPEEGEDCGD